MTDLYRFTFKATHKRTERDTWGNYPPNLNTIERTVTVIAANEADALVKVKALLPDMPPPEDRPGSRWKHQSSQWSFRVIEPITPEPVQPEPAPEPSRTRRPLQHRGLRIYGRRAR